MMTIEGTIHRSGISTTIWTLVTREGTSYEILPNAPQHLLQSGMRVRVRGQIRNNVMTTAMSGSALEVKSFELLPP